MCRTAERGTEGSFKDVNLNVCHVRDEKCGEEVRCRLSGALVDLHASDGRYHNDCRKQFMNSKSVKVNPGASRDPYHDANVAAFESVVESMKADVGRMWTSVEVNNVFLCNGGYYFDRWRLINKLSSHFGPSLLGFSSPGIASILMF